MGTILEFYKGKMPNQEGLFFDDIMRFKYDELENNHYYIQWLFPLIEPSIAVPGSPTISEEDISVLSAPWKNIEEMKEKMKLREKIVEAFHKMIYFYGFKLTLEEPSKKVIIVKDARTFEERSKKWLTPKNHNFLRLTRILNSLRIMGCPSSAKMLYDCLCDIYDEYKGVIDPLTKHFWDEAVKE